VIVQSLKSEFGGLAIGDILYLHYYDFPTLEAVGALYNITAQEKDWPPVVLDISNHSW